MEGVYRADAVFLFAIRVCNTSGIVLPAKDFSYSSIRPADTKPGKHACLKLVWLGRRGLRICQATNQLVMAPLTAETFGNLSIHLQPSPGFARNILSARTPVILLRPVTFFSVEGALRWSNWVLRK